jgi:hypothetical protein
MSGSHTPGMASGRPAQSGRRFLLLPNRMRSLREFAVFGCTGALLVVGGLHSPAAIPPAPMTDTIGIRRVSLMPDCPSPFLVPDWKAVATNYDAFVFNYHLSGQYLPLIKTNLQNPNFVLPWFALPSYVGVTNYAESEAINAMAAVLGATLVGIDKSDQNGTNWTRMMIQYFNHRDGVDVLFNNSLATTMDFWYNLLPHLLFYGLVDRYPEVAALSTAYSGKPGSASMTAILRTTAQKWHDACVGLGATTTTAPNFNRWGYDFLTSQPLTNSWVEPEAAAGVAWLEYMAWRESGQTNADFLQAADWALQFVQNSESNILYEVLLPFGVLAGARMNAELGRDYDVNKFLNWCFDGDSYCRPGWGVIAGTWGGSDVDGLAGSLTDGGGYAFAMDTFDWAGALAPIARYDQRYAHDLGKWLLNLASSARLFYAAFIPAAQQSSPNWLGGTNAFISYEGLRASWNGTNLYATGDAVRSGWAGTDYGLYGGSHVGFLGALVGRTSDEKVLQLDLLATDFFRDAAWPTYLHYNPYSTNVTIIASYGAGTNDLLDIVTERFLATRAVGGVALTLPPDSAVVVAVIPSSAAMGTQGGRMYADGRIVDYRYAGLDADADGLPDWWESRYYGNPTNASPAALARNGRTNLECYLLGLNPLDPTTDLRLQISFQPDTGFPLLSWPTIGGITYSLYAADRLGAAGNFQGLFTAAETNAPVGMPGVQTFIDSQNATNPAASRYYRVQVP